MLSKSQQLLLVLGFCLGVASADVDCSKRPTFVDPHTCCPLPEFISDDLKEKCQEYNVTMPPPPAMSGEQNGEGRRHHPHHHNHPSPCFMSCVFNETGIYEDDKVDSDKLKDYLQVVFKDDSDLQTLATDAFTTCATKIEEFKSKMGNRPPPPPPTGLPFCPMKPAFLMGCVYKKMFKDCPAAIWTDTQECNDAREHFENCKPPHRRSPNSQ
ncbi:general odorant-binding protein 67-like [Drosophila nasuta]|uniref:general odorant-binding protein 67-like n=1 Tax=Drosophila nasuta TaxID=42062 RepID=UPI00295E795B|nr:general odorant-binding protein 67-like [Drosophila nasuta]